MWCLRGCNVSAGERGKDETCESHTVASKRRSRITRERDTEANTYGGEGLHGSIKGAHFSEQMERQLSAVHEQ